MFREFLAMLLLALPIGSFLRTAIPPSTSAGITVTVYLTPKLRHPLCPYGSSCASRHPRLAASCNPARQRSAADLLRGGRLRALSRPLRVGGRARAGRDLGLLPDAQPRPRDRRSRRRG